MKYLIAILVVAFALRVYQLNKPSTYYFDEVYHAVTAKLYARNDPSGYEWWHPAPEPETAIEWLHPPIAKLTQAVGIKIFGENAFGWRISSVVFGLGVIAATYFLAQQLFASQRLSVLSALLVSVDGLLFAQSRVAMNDIHVVFFILCSLISYIRFKQAKQKQSKWLLFMTGLFAGLAVSTKWSGIFVIGIFIGDQILSIVKAWKLPSVNTLGRFAVAWLALPALVYVLSFGQFWLQGHTVEQFVELHKQIWYYQTHLTATHTYQSTPLQWVFDIRPVWLHVDYSVPNKVGNIYNLGNPILFIVGLFSVLFLLAKAIHSFKWEWWFLFLSYILVWFPWVFSPRIMFFYHYAPAVPLLCIALSCVLTDLFKKKMAGVVIASGIITLAVAWFVVFYPNLTGIPVPSSFAEKVYFAIPSWK